MPWELIDNAQARRVAARCKSLSPADRGKPEAAHDRSPNHMPEWLACCLFFVQRLPVIATSTPQPSRSVVKRKQVFGCKSTLLDNV
jgi:hypothetical protein